MQRFFLSFIGAGLCFFHSNVLLHAITQCSPFGVITETQPTFTWEAEPDAGWYLLWVAKEDASETMVKKWYYTNNITKDGVCSCVLDEELVEGNEYIWWVQSMTTTGLSEWSNGMMFEVGSEAELNPSIDGVFMDDDCSYLLVNGRHFGETPKVFIDDVQLTISECSDAYLIAEVPDYLGSGNFKVKVLRMPEITDEREILSELQFDEMDFTAGNMGHKGPMGSQGEKGPQGDKGPKGSKGDRGSKGPQGEQGNPGPQGMQGPTGQTGDDGPQGPDGKNGFSIAWKGDWASGTSYSEKDLVHYNGSTYASVSDSNQGNLPGSSGRWTLVAGQGEQGSQGVQGIQGDPGPQGQGLQGEDGPQGEQGPQGDPGLQGGPGPQGARGPQGATGPSGANGIDGTDGVGAQWRGTWDSATSYSLYDLVYYDGSTYESASDSNQGNNPHSGGSWELVVLRSSPGHTGATGAMGAMGATGAKGPRGDKGANGADATLSNLMLGIIRMYNNTCPAFSTSKFSSSILNDPYRVIVEGDFPHRIHVIGITSVICYFVDADGNRVSDTEQSIGTAFDNYLVFCEISNSSGRSKDYYVDVQYLYYSN